jgi:hypothetical protein
VPSNLTGEISGTGAPKSSDLSRLYPKQVSSLSSPGKPIVITVLSAGSGDVHFKALRQVTMK